MKSLLKIMAVVSVVIGIGTVIAYYMENFGARYIEIEQDEEY